MLQRFRTMIKNTCVHMHAGRPTDRHLVVVVVVVVVVAAAAAAVVVVVVVVVGAVARAHVRTCARARVCISLLLVLSVARPSRSLLCSHLKTSLRSRSGDTLEVDSHPRGGKVAADGGRAHSPAWRLFLVVPHSCGGVPISAGRDGAPPRRWVAVHLVQQAATLGV